MNSVVHFEIPFDDQARAEAFYRDVFGWKINTVPKFNYSLVETVASGADGSPTKPGAINGGMVQRGEPVKGTVVTMNVDDIDAALKLIETHGGKVVRGKQSVGPMGWNAYATDSEGNVIGLWQNAQ